MIETILVQAEEAPTDEELESMAVWYLERGVIRPPAVEALRRLIAELEALPDGLGTALASGLLVRDVLEAVGADCACPACRPQAA